MTGPGCDGDDRTFRVKFAGDGAVRLRERVKEKLGEFMGSYTDDTLVEYVVVLLRNGRHKDEAWRELKVFLGDDSLSFVSWLWDHLSSNLHLYVQPEESFPNKLVKTSPNNDLSRRHNLQRDHAIGDVHTDSEYERETSTRLSISRRNREWKGLVHETELFPLRSTVADMSQSEERTHGRPNLVRRSHSPILQINKKRARQNEGQPMKRSTVSYPVIGAPRRLLQFAVRDAVRTVRQLSSRTEPDLKRLRSVDSLSATKSVLNERAERMRSVARVSALSTALKAATEAAKDALKVGYSGGVFDSLGHGMTTTDPDNQPSHNTAPVLEDGEYECFNEKRESNFVDYYQSSRFDGESTGDITMVGKDAGFTAYSALASDRYDNVGIVRQRGINISQSASSASKGKSSLKVQSSVAQDADQVIRKTRLMDEDASTSAAAKASSKIVNISVNVNTWKPPCYQAPRKVIEAENHMLDMNESSAGRPNVRLHKENDTAMAENENEISPSYFQRESQKTVASASGSHTTTRPSEDVDSRIVFVSNVHFAATKDTLSRHFNKFGVLKVIILTDAATGQPKGSAYVEFLRKDSAELALSLNGTSFMSRILKVVRKSSVNHEAAPMFGWSRIARASAFAASRLAYPRGALDGAFRARLQIKPGARSLQWKRGALTAQTSEDTKGLLIPSLASGNSMLSPVGRNLTYVRADSKANGISGPA